MSDLHKWLEKKAKLSGVKLDKVIQLCENNFVTDLSDLREVFDQGNLAELFPQIALRGKLERALSMNKPTQSPGEPSSPDLPPHKRFGTFASHKKKHSQFGDVCEVRTHHNFCWLAPQPHLFTL